MEDNAKLVRVFDRVKLSQKREEAILADLLRGTKEVVNMKNARKRRLPAAALAAAVLIVVLAGTALAGGYFGRLDVSPLGENYKKGYNVQGAYENIPQERLSEELLEYLAQAEVRKGGELSFSSWSEAEEFIGVEIANNPMLEEMERSYRDSPPEGDIYISPENVGRCTAHVSYSRGQDGVRVENILLHSDYFGDEESHFGVNVLAYMRIKAENQKDQPVSWKRRDVKNVSEEKYVTPSGMEVTIITQDGTIIDGVDGTTFQQSFYTAYFTLNNALFQLDTIFNEQTADCTLSMLKQVLDAYE